MKVVFFGTPDFAVYTLRALVESHHQVALVVTQPDRPRGRGQKLVPSPIKAFALEASLPVIQPETLPDRVLSETMAVHKPDALVVVAYGLKIPLELLNATSYGPINLHGSLLPKYRGAAPMQRAILDGEAVTGVTTMRMDEGWDTGDMLLRSETAITPEDNLGTIHDRLAVIGANLIVETLDGLENGLVRSIPQDNDCATKAPKIPEEARWIDWNRSSWDIHNLIRALDPIPGALTKRNGQNLRVWRSQWGKAMDNIPDTSPGSIVGEAKGCGLWIKTGDGALLITEIQEEGGKRLAVPAYIAGHPIRSGESWA